MDALKEYYEIVFQFDEFLELILGTELYENQLNLTNAFFDVVCATNESQIEQFYSLEMTRSNKVYEAYINEIRQMVDERNSTHIQYYFNQTFFSQDRFRYLFNLVNEDYFCQFLKSFNFYRQDEHQNCFLQFGKQPLETAQLPEIKRKIIDPSKLFHLSNGEFCLVNGKSIGPFAKSEFKLINNTNCLKSIKELNIFRSFLNDIYEPSREFIESKIKTAQNSHLLDPRKSIKLQFYSLDLANQRLNRERIFANQNLNECKDQFLNRFAKMNGRGLFEQIFREDEETKKTIFQTKIAEELILLLGNFISNHKSCKFIYHLEKTCAISNLLTDYDQSNAAEQDLHEFVKQDRVSEYIKTILNHLMPDKEKGLFGDNSLERWFNLIPFQNGNIDIYYSNFYYRFDFKKVLWFKNLVQSSFYAFKIRVIHHLITWLSEYVLDLLHFSFFVVKGTRLKFYRFDQWIKIVKKQLIEWKKKNKIAICSFKKNDAIGADHFDFECSFRTCSEQIQIHSLLPVNSALEEHFVYANTILKAICTDRVRMFRTEMNFYNQLKEFYLKCKSNNKGIHYFKFQFDIQLCEIDVNKLEKILLYNLNDFLKKFQLDHIEIRKVNCFSKIKRLRKNEIHYVNIEGLDLLNNLTLSGCYDLENNLVNETDFSKILNKQFVYYLVLKFIKNHRLKFDDRYLVIKDGLPFNDYLTNQLLVLYLNNLIETSFMSNPNVLYFCEHNQLICFTNNPNDFINCSRSILANLKNYNLKLRTQNSFSSQDMPELSTLRLNRFMYNRFELRLDDRKPIEYKSELHDVKNIKSSFSFHLFERPDQFAKLLSESFLDSFKFFILDESCCTFEEVYYHLFVYFAFYAVQIFYFIENTIILTKDENPGFIFELIFDLICNILQQITYKQALIVNFKYSITCFELLWLLVKSLEVTWSKLIRRSSELEMLKKIQTWIRPNLSQRASEIKDEDFSESFNKLMKEVDFCITRNKKK